MSSTQEIKKIRILFTIPNFDTAGSGHVVYKLAMGLNKDLFEVEICTRSTKGELFQLIEESGIKIHVYDYLTPVKPLFKFIGGIIKTRRFFKSISPDIIHSYHYASEFSEGMAARLSGCKWIFTKKNMAWGNWSWKLRSMLANRIVTTNQTLKSVNYANHPKVSLIYSSVDLNQFPYHQSHQSCQHFVVIGNISEIKGSLNILKSFLLYSETHSGNLYFIGDDHSSYANDLKKILNEHPNKDRVIFTGKTSDIKQFLIDGHCLIMGSDRKGEGGPVALLEAMASGIIVIGSNVPGINEQLAHFPELLFEPNSEVSLVNKMHEISELPSEIIKQLSLALRSEIETNFSLEIELLKHEELYLKMMQQ